MTITVTQAAGFSSGFSSPFFSGLPTTASVPGQYHVAIDGHPYLLNLSHPSVETIGGWTLEGSLPLLRDQADQSDEPGGQSISPEQMWRRTQESWHGGQGQQFFDRAESSRSRYRSGKGVNPWTKWKLSTLNQTARVQTFSGGSGSSLVTAGTRVYAASGANSNLSTSPDPYSSWTAGTGTPATGCTSLASDGVFVYSAWGSNRVYVNDSSSGTPQAATAFITSGNPVSLLGYVKGRLLAANGPNLYELTGSGALPAPFFTHPNSAWTWVAFAEGDQVIYAVGFAGSHSAVYKIAVPQGTTGIALADVSRAGVLPTGEVARGAVGYLGFLLAGTDRGVRLATASDAGNLTFGALIETTGAVYGFSTWDRFIWFTWTSFDSTSSGLGRIDLAVIHDGLTPAYASDVMATVTGTVHAATVASGRQLFAIDADGVWAETLNTPVASATLDTGLITYGITDPKIATFVDVRHEPLVTGASVAVSLATDGGTFLSLGTSNAVGSSGSPPLATAQPRGENHELRFTIVKATLRRWMLRIIPAPTRTREWTLPLIFREQIEVGNGVTKFMDVGAEKEHIAELHRTQRMVTFQFGLMSTTGIVSDYQFKVQRNTGTEAHPKFNWTGDNFVTIREVAG